MARIILVALLVGLAFTAAAAPVASAAPAPAPGICDIWSGAPGICWDYDNGCPPPPMYCMPP